MLEFLYSIIKSPRIRIHILNLIARNEGGYAFSKTVRKVFQKHHGIKIGYGTYGGCFNLNNVPKGVTFGNYCSIAPSVKIFRANHPINYFTTHPILYNPVMGYAPIDELTRVSLNIGNDVWIGENVIITPSVKIIEDGAVIGAGSIVTKDVEKYTVIVGNPAKPIKKRFSEEIIKKIEKTHWWDLNIKELKLQIPYLNKITDECK